MRNYPPAISKEFIGNVTQILDHLTEICVVINVRNVTIYIDLLANYCGMHICVVYLSSRVRHIPEPKRNHFNAYKESKLNV